MDKVLDRIGPPFIAFVVATSLFFSGRIDGEAWERFALIYLGIEGGLGMVSTWRASVERVETQRAEIEHRALTIHNEPPVSIRSDGRPTPCR